jgi:hypothetical protein
MDAFATLAGGEPKMALPPPMAQLLDSVSKGDPCAETSEGPKELRKPPLEMELRGGDRSSSAGHRHSIY